MYIKIYLYGTIAGSGKNYAQYKTILPITFAQSYAAFQYRETVRRSTSV
jgi:hypothetical protein